MKRHTVLMDWKIQHMKYVTTPKLIYVFNEIITKTKFNL